MLKNTLQGILLEWCSIADEVTMNRYIYIQNPKYLIAVFY